ncbi:hypothetical protein LTR27_011841 [Elasticomyces elasticus]|nr:hypothetical protein LTR27_011841 [Elasticomyces elasticus]
MENAALSKGRQPTDLLGLPAELRLSIFEFLFEDMVASPKHVWAELPNDMEFWRSKFTKYKHYISLLQTSQQIYREARSLFLSTYASRLTIYFSNAVELVEFVDHDYNPDHTVLGNAQFLLYTHRNPHKEADMQPIVEAAEYLWKQQPGYNRDWEWLAGYYGEKIDMSIRGEWDYETDGFELLAGGHDYCSSSKECAPYRVLKWPIFGNGCHLVGYQCKRSDLPSSVRMPGNDKELHCVVFQGRFRNLRLGQFHRADRAEDLAHARSVKCAQVFCNLCNRRFDGEDESSEFCDDGEDEEDQNEDSDESEANRIESGSFDGGSDDGDEAEETEDDRKSAEEWALVPTHDHRHISTTVFNNPPSFMETSQSSQKRAHAGEVDENENIAKHSSKRVKDTDPASSDVSTPTSIFDLPGELRNVVYGYALDNLVEAPCHPYDKLPENSRLEHYTALLQTSKQVKEEVQSLFLHDYLDRITFYFTNPVELVQFARELMSRPDWRPLSSARFYLFTGLGVNNHYDQYELQQSTETLWKHQLDYDRVWKYPPGQYLYQSYESSWRSEQWKPEEHGFRHLPGSHDACDMPSYCKPFQVLKWPMLKNGCRFAAYCWRSKPGWLEGERQFGGISFEGRWADLNYQEFDLDLGIARLKHTRGEDCGLDPCHVCEGHGGSANDCRRCELYGQGE